MIFKRKQKIPNREFKPEWDITTYELALLVGYGFGLGGLGWNERAFQNLPDGAKRHFKIIDK